jgi:hypothetical protein
MKFIDDEATSFSIKIEDYIVRRLVEVVVVDGLRLVCKDLLPI